MKHMNKTCVDAGTINCPCPLAETGDCLVCSRLSGSDKCDCSWCGLCIYNEFIQNDKKIPNLRRNEKCRIAEKKWYSEDLLKIVLTVPRGFALKAAVPGSFVFLNSCDENDFCNVPISVMKADIQRAQIHVAMKVISAKTKKIAKEEKFLMVRGVYRSGILGGGAETIFRLSHGTDEESREKWLVLTKGIGLAPAVNIIDYAGDKVDIELVVDPEKITDDFIKEVIHVKKTLMPLSELKGYTAEDYNKVFILASDHYIDVLAARLNVPEHKLVHSNNFHMCCGEGMCGACSYVDEEGKVTKMCKCKRLLK